MIEIHRQMFDVGQVVRKSRLALIVGPFIEGGVVEELQHPPVWAHVTITCQFVALVIADDDIGNRHARLTSERRNVGG